jgi:hypothetical protein
VSVLTPYQMAGGNIAPSTTKRTDLRRRRTIQFYPHQLEGDGGESPSYPQLNRERTDTSSDGWWEHRPSTTERTDRQRPAKQLTTIQINWRATGVSFDFLLPRYKLISLTFFQLVGGKRRSIPSGYGGLIYSVEDKWSGVSLVRLAAD